MIRLAADENLNNHIVRGLQRRSPAIDIVRIQDVVGLTGKDDPTVLDWCARENRILVSHDVKTIRKYANERVAAGRNMPGVVLVSRSVSVSQAIEDLLILAEGSMENEWEGQALYLPL